MASTRIVSDTTVTADTNYAPVDLPDTIGKDTRIVFQVAWGAITGTKDCTIKLEATVDGTNYDLLGSEVVMTADNDSTMFSVENFGYTKIRAVYTENNATNVSTLKVYVSLPSTLATAV